MAEVKGFNRDLFIIILIMLSPVYVIGYTKMDYMNVSPRAFKRIINLYPPYLGAGVKVDM